MVTPSFASEPWFRALYPFSPKRFAPKQGAPWTMSYLDEGPPDAPLMLMVHGNPTWSFYYRRVVEAFCDRFRCIVPDHIGCGLSDKPQKQAYPYTLAQRIDDLDALVASLDTTAPITLVLHDWGGAIGMGFAARHPDRIERIILSNTAAFRSPTIPFSIDICRIPVLGPLAVRGFNGFARVAQWRAIADRRKLSGDVGRGYLAPYDSWNHRVAIQRFVEDIPMGPDHPSYQTLVEVEEGLRHFEQTPMLIVWGEQDFCFGPNFRREWERRFPQAEVHALDDASHYVLEDAPERMLLWMERFVSVRD